MIILQSGFNTAHVSVNSALFG